MIIFFTCWNDISKAKQFQKLEEAVKEQDIAVVRGQSGVTKSVNIWKDLVVGDVILLEPGCRVPADCVVIEATDLLVDEIFYNDEKPLIKKKLVATSENMEENPDCFLLSQTLIKSGVGKAVVCCVGKYSRRVEVEQAILDKPVEDPDTPLAEKLEKIGG